jgi:hypothetical protein
LTYSSLSRDSNDANKSLGLQGIVTLDTTRGGDEFDSQLPQNEACALRSNIHFEEQNNIMEQPSWASTTTHLESGPFVLPILDYDIPKMNTFLGPCLSTFTSQRPLNPYDQDSRQLMPVYGGYRNPDPVSDANNEAVRTEPIDEGLQQAWSQVYMLGGTGWSEKNNEITGIDKVPWA